MNSKDNVLELYKKMLELRTFEEKIVLEYPKGNMRTPTHLGIGQEAVAVGVISERESSDVIFSHHRCHNHFLAAGGSHYSLFAELLGRVDGCSGGRGGSVHLVDRGVNFLGSSPILTQAVAFATGAAFAFKFKEEVRAAIVFFGDAAFEEGTMWESFNFAVLNKLPVLFVCENNLYSTESNLEKRVPPNTSFVEKARAFGMFASTCDGNNVEEVAKHSRNAFDHIKSGGGPYLLECLTYRTREHVGPNFDFEFQRNYRSKEEIQKWITKCPILSSAEVLKQVYGFSEVELLSIKKQISELIESAFNLAEKSPFPLLESHLEHLYGL
jgi:pyruvate dehydrogenase E1 component alpha subunit